MTLATGSRLGPYEILSPLGAGGMGEVYRARDTRLQREVAVKVLNPQLSATPEAQQRFEREARAISQISHPHICALYDVGRADGIEYLVMELLEGETLAERLAKGALTIEQALRYGVEIAGALDQAHRHGVVHRDLKPGNVMLTKSGVKLLDFGLAKLKPGSETADASGSQLPTQESPVTTEGTLVGTLQYMSPEQLEGEAADARSDIFAFGAVLYEMATGRKAFSAGSRASLITAIMSSDPAPISSVRPMTPPALDRAAKKCLARDPDDRWQSAADLESELKWIGESTVPTVAPAAAGRRGTRNRLPWALVGLFLLSTLALIVASLSRSRPSPEPGAIRFVILPPTRSSPDLMSWDPACLALSPDGRAIVFCAATLDGKHLLWVRSLDSLTPRALSGTDDATCPFWSPDSRSIGFFAGGSLKKIEAGGGPAVTVCAAPDARGGAWSRDGSILFAPNFEGPISRVSASGGAASPVTAIDPARHETTHRWPQFLPDGRHFLYLAGSRETEGESEKNSVYLGSLDSGKSRILLHARSNTSYASGHLLFVRETALMAQRFDLRRLELEGQAFPIVKRVQYQSGYFRGVFTASDNGVLAYQEGGSYASSRLLWFDRKGKQVGSIGEPGGYFNASISPDGQRVATDLFDPEAGTGDLWIYELANGVKSRFTFGAGENYLPLWSPDGSRIVFASNRKGHADLFQKAAVSGGGEEELLVSSTEKEPTDWSPDGRFIVYNELDAKAKTKGDLRILPLFGDRKPFAFLESAANEVNARFSPDGRWVAYVSDESGRNEVYAAPFPSANAKWQISGAGGDEPRWRRDGRELFYMSPDGKMMAAEIRTRGAALEVGAVLPLFATQSKSVGSLYDVAAGGQRFLINSVDEQEASPITLVVHWTTLLKK